MRRCEIVVVVCGGSLLYNILVVVVICVMRDQGDRGQSNSGQMSVLSDSLVLIVSYFYSDKYDLG